MSSGAPPDAISASSAGTGSGNKKKNKKKANKPKKAIDTEGSRDGDGVTDQQPTTPASPDEGTTIDQAATKVDGHTIVTAVVSLGPLAAYPMTPSQTHLRAADTSSPSCMYFVLS